MKNNISQNGFTLIEILVAVFIMSVGFLALSQMEFLSVRQKQMAEAGSNATNTIQFAGDRDKDDKDSDLNTGTQISVGIETFLPSGGSNVY